MRRFLAASMLILFAAPVFAADEAKPNTLTPKEIADGWLLLFDGATTFGWKTSNDAKWKVAGGTLAPQPDKAGLFVTTTRFRECELRLQYEIKKDVASKPLKPDDPRRPMIRLVCGPDGRSDLGKGTQVILEDGQLLKGPDKKSKGWLDVNVSVVED